MIIPYARGVKPEPKEEKTENCYYLQQRRSSQKSSSYQSSGDICGDSINHICLLRNPQWRPKTHTKSPNNKR